MATLASGNTDFTYDQAAVSGTATFVGDEHAAFAVLVNRAANEIAKNTRRGAGNWLVLSPLMLTVLQSQQLHQHLHVQLKAHLKHQQTQNSLVL